MNTDPNTTPEPDRGVGQSSPIDTRRNEQTEQTDDRTMSLRLLPGARRVQGYPELVVDGGGPPGGAHPVTPRPPGPPGPPPVSNPAPGRDGVSPPPAPAPGGPPPGGLWNGPSASVTAPVRPDPATWGWRGRLKRGTAGAVKLRPGAVELAHRAAIAHIGAATWPRAVNVLVANPKGGVGKTPAAVILAGILGQLRGGSVAVWEAAESAGTLTTRAEGTPTHGLGELLAGLGGVRTAGHLAGYTAPQTSHADIIGTVGPRRLLTGDDVIGLRRVVDTYYRMTITDTGNNLGHLAFLAALHTTDTVVIPCLPTIDALAGVEQLGQLIHTAGGRVGGDHGLIRRAVVVLGHDGGPENSTVAAGVRDRLDALGLPVLEVPYEPMIRDGGPITLARLTDPAARAWTAAAAAVVTALHAAPTHEDLVRLAATPRPAARPGNANPPRS